MTYVPGDSIPPLPKSIEITSPTASDSWKKGVQASIAYAYQNIDSVQILFSTDSMATWANLLTGDIALPVSNNPFLFTPANYFSKPFGVLIVKDKSSSVADTSAYFGLEMANGLNEGFGLNQVLIYPNPTSGIIKVESEQLNILQISVFDLQGRFILEAKGNELNLETLSAGSYILKIESDAGFVLKRVIKK
jgi:hypothetical protein